MKPVVVASGHIEHSSLAEWQITLGPTERTLVRAIAEVLAKDEQAVLELESWLLIGHAAIHAWACAERQIAEMKDLILFAGGRTPGEH